MSKNNNTQTASPIRAEFDLGTDALKLGFEKTSKLYERVRDFNSGNIEAYIESATVVGNGLQSVARDSTSYAKQTIEEALAASKALMSAKSINEAIELQTSFAKTSFANYVKQLSRFNDFFCATAKESSAPLQARIEAAAKYIQSPRS